MPTSATAVTGRRYAGRSTVERQEERRTRLLEAGLELFGTEGWSASPIERLCAQARVATRSFYEEFSSREALLLAVYAQITQGAARAVAGGLEAAGQGIEQRVEAGLRAYIGHLTEDPRR